MPSDDDDFKVMLERVHGGIRETELDLILREQPDIREYGLMEGESLRSPFRYWLFRSSVLFSARSASTDHRRG